MIWRKSAEKKSFCFCFGSVKEIESKKGKKTIIKKKNVRFLMVIVQPLGWREGCLVHTSIIAIVVRVVGGDVRNPRGTALPAEASERTLRTGSWTPNLQRPTRLIWRQCGRATCVDCVRVCFIYVEDKSCDVENQQQKHIETHIKYENHDDDH